MDIIKSSDQISDLFTHGKRVHTSYVTFIVLPQQHGLTNNSCGRVAFVAGKKLGNAVWRNAAKRRMRAVCREIGGPWKGYDVVMLAKGRLVDSSYQKVLSACKEASLKISDATTKADL